MKMLWNPAIGAALGISREDAIKEGEKEYLKNLPTEIMIGKLSTRQVFIIDLVMEKPSTLGEIHTAVNAHFAINSTVNAIKKTVKRLHDRNILWFYTKKKVYRVYRCDLNSYKRGSK